MPYDVVFAALDVPKKVYDRAEAIGYGQRCRDDGPPGLRDYYPHYYGAFLFDPFGNRLETVCQHAGTD